VNEVALAKVREDKQRESGDGFDGTWVAHPDLVDVALAEFDRPNQLDRLREDVSVGPDELTRFDVPGGEITEDGLRTNVSVGVRYLAAWLAGTGAAAIDNLMEDAATAEISRSQVWQWLRAGRFTADEVRREVDVLRGEHPDASEVFEQVALSEELVEFLTLVAYDRLP
jgi:malate synthase